MAASVSSLDTTVVSNTTTGEVFIPFTIVTDDGPVLPGFLTSGGGDFIAVQLPDTGFLLNSTRNNSVQITSLPHPAVEIVNDTVRGGVAYVLRDQVYYQYNLDTPVTEPLQINFQLNYFVDGPRITSAISHIPVLRGTLEIIPPGKSIDVAIPSLPPSSSFASYTPLYDSRRLPRSLANTYFLPPTKGEVGEEGLGMRLLF